VIQAADSNTARRRSISVLRDHFIWLSFPPNFQALSILHHYWTNHLDQKMIDQIGKALQNG